MASRERSAGQRRIETVHGTPDRFHTPLVRRLLFVQKAYGSRPQTRAIGTNGGGTRIVDDHGVGCQATRRNRRRYRQKAERAKPLSNAPPMAIRGNVTQRSAREACPATGAGCGTVTRAAGPFVGRRRIGGQCGGGGCRFRRCQRTIFPRKHPFLNLRPEARICGRTP